MPRAGGTVLPLVLLRQFEWIEGNTARFGLVHTDFGTQERAVKRSGEFYAKMIKNGGVTQEMYDEYVAPQVYNVQ